MMIGVTRESLQRNIMNELCDMLATKPVSTKTNECQILGRQMYLIGANDESAVRKIQGSTLALAYVDEAACIPEPFFRMLLSRLSKPGAQLLATCNPEGPHHWLKTDFIDRVDELDIGHWQFTLDDNPALDQAYKDNLKKEYSGHWYARYILGEWAVASGLIYDSLSTEQIDDTAYPDPNYYIAGIDYGSTNPTTCVLVGVSPNQWPQLRVEKEYYFDSAKEMRSKTDAELADDIEAFLRTTPVRAIYVDPSAASFRIELNRRNLPVMEANNDVLQGIKVVSKFIAQRNIIIRPQCENLIKELMSYAWDSKAAQRGIDKPVKENDHACFVAGTQIATAKGCSPIEQIQIGDYVMTRKGPRKVVNTMCSKVSNVVGLEASGRYLIGTHNHPVWTAEGWKDLKDMIGYHQICVVEKEEACLKNVKRSDTTGCSTGDIQNQKIYPTGNILSATLKAWTEGLGSCIATCGKVITETFRTGFTYITLTETRAITASKIWNVCRPRSIWQNISHGLAEKKNCFNTSKKSGQKQKIGTRAQKAENGTASTQKSHGSIESLAHTCVSTVEKATKPLKGAGANSALTSVNQLGDEPQVWMISNVNAQCAIRPLSLIDIQKFERAQGNVVDCGEDISVYNLEVEQEHEYFANGILVHNCDAARYAIFSAFQDGELSNPNDNLTLDQARREIHGYNPMSSLMGEIGYGGGMYQ